jgi:hypothetical protein
MRATLRAIHPPGAASHGAPRAERKQHQEPGEASDFTVAAWSESKSRSAKPALALARRKRALLLFNRGPVPRRGGGGKPVRVARMDAREFVVRPWTACRQTPQPPRDPDFAWTQNQARHRGVLLFGYFLLDKQEKVTRPPLRGTKLAKSQLRLRGKRNASESLDSRLRGNDGDLRRSREDQHHPHPNPLLEGEGEVRCRTKSRTLQSHWIPACAGMTKIVVNREEWKASKPLGSRFRENDGVEAKSQRSTPSSPQPSP